jgi:hypothetical protein
LYNRMCETSGGGSVAEASGLDPSSVAAAATVALPTKSRRLQRPDRSLKSPSSPGPTHGPPSVLTLT